jgi:regulator of replication initiation timing
MKNNNERAFRHVYVSEFPVADFFKDKPVWCEQLGMNIIPMEEGKELELRNLLYVFKEKLQQCESDRNEESGKYLLACDNFQNQFEHWKRQAKDLKEKLGASVREISLLNSKIEELKEDLANKEYSAPWMDGAGKEKFNDYVRQQIADGIKKGQERAQAELDKELTPALFQRYGFIKSNDGLMPCWWKGTNPITQDFMLIIRWSPTALCYFYKNIHHKIRTVRRLDMLWQVLTGESLLNTALDVQECDARKAEQSNEAGSQKPPGK